MQWFKNLLFKWRRFLRPVPGWQGRIRAFRSGVKIWAVPGHPEASKLIPFPLQWVPHSFALETETEKTRCFRFLDATCIDSGKAAPIGVGVLCLRCAVPLHPTSAHMATDFDAPYCRRCRWPLLLV